MDLWQDGKFGVPRDIRRGSPAGAKVSFSFGARVKRITSAANPGLAFAFLMKYIHKDRLPATGAERNILDIGACAAGSLIKAAHAINAWQMRES
jgi:hypothetical protein